MVMLIRQSSFSAAATHLVSGIVFLTISARMLCTALFVQPSDQPKFEKVCRDYANDEL